MVDCFLLAALMNNHGGPLPGPALMPVISLLILQWNNVEFNDGPIVFLDTDNVGDHDIVAIQPIPDGAMRKTDSPPEFLLR